MVARMYIILLALVIAIAGANITTTSERILGNTKSDLSTTDFKNNNGTAIIKLKRRAVLIINRDSALRVRYPKKTTSLLYQDFDDDGKLLNSYYMYGLSDVAEFFRVFLETEICHVTCENRNK